MDKASVYLPMKKKSIQCPVVQEPQRVCELKDDASMSQMNGSKRFEHIQRVPLPSMDFQSANCSVMSSAALTNGAAPGFMVPPPPPVVLGQAPGPHRDPGWNCDPDRGPDPWAASREAWRKVQAWSSSREQDAARAEFGTDFEAQPGPSTGPGLEPELQAEPERVWTQSPGREERWREQQWSTRPPVISNGPNAIVVGPSGVHAGPSGVHAGPSGVHAGPSGVQAGPSGVQAGPSGVQAGPSGVQAEPSGVQAGPSGVQAGHSGVQAGHSGVQAGHSGVQAGHSGVQAGHSGVQAGPSGVQAGPSGVQAGPSGVQAGPSGVQAGPSRIQAGPSGVQVNLIPRPSRKEPPVYPPGSQEEQWQLRIEDKGRVTCPRCKSVCRKTVEGLKKHMNNCKVEPYTCPHCGKQLKTPTGMKYHIMADHSLLPLSSTNDSDERVTKEKLRKILKRLGRLKCSREGCTAGFTSVVGYTYHMKTCGQQQDELQKLVLSCSHCGKTYKSKAGLKYHIRNEHAPAPEGSAPQPQPRDSLQSTSCGRAKRASAQAANLQLAQIAQIELPKVWSKKKFQSDRVPEDHKLQYTRPGLPSFSQDVLKKWRSEVKMYRKVGCPNQGCGCTYTSVSGLKAHLGLCTKGDFAAGKYRCLICNKEFNSESGVKYHINSVHEQEWFVTNKKHIKLAKNLSPSNPNDKCTQTPPSHCSLLALQNQPQHCPHQLQPLQPLHHLAQQQNHLLHHFPDPCAAPDLPQGAVEIYVPMQTVWIDERGDKQPPQSPKNMDQTSPSGAARCGFDFAASRGCGQSGEDGNSGGGGGGFTEEEMERQIWEEKRRMLESVEIVRRQ